MVSNYTQVCYTEQRLEIYTGKYRLNGSGKYLVSDEN